MFQPRFKKIKIRWHEGVLEFRAPRISQSEINICSALTRTKILHELIVPFLVTAQHRTAGGLRIYGAMATPIDEKWERVQRLNQVKGWLTNIFLLHF